MPVKHVRIRLRQQYKQLKGIKMNSIFKQKHSHSEHSEESYSQVLRVLSGRQSKRHPEGFSPKNLTTTHPVILSIAKNLISGSSRSLRMTVMTVLALVFTVARGTPVMADSCAGGMGKEIIGADGEKYCQSKMSVNWWSAFAWCEATGGTLVSLDDCNGKNGDIKGDKSCPNFNDKIDRVVWTSSVYSDTLAYYINTNSTGAVDCNSKDTKYAALCKF